jgi:hypothetical protein
VAGGVEGGGGGGAVTNTDDGSDAQPASKPIAPQAANSAIDGNLNPSARAEIIVFILNRRLPFWPVVHESTSSYPGLYTPCPILLFPDSNLVEWIKHGANAFCGGP